MPKLVCIAARERGVYSQTFIRAHIERLPAEVRTLYLAELAAGRSGAVREFLATEKFDVVLAEFGNTGVDVMNACYELGLPLVVRFAGEDAYCEAPRWQAVRNFYLPLFRSSARLVAVSHDMERQLHSLGAPKEKIRYCPSGADADLFYGGAPQNCPPLFVSVGRFVDKKAPYLTLLAFQQVAKACPEARLIMVGTGYLLDACMRLAQALGIARRVSFEGIRSHEQVAAILRGARCFVQHSVRAADGNSEGTPNSIMEAGATGLPIVATRHGGIRDVVIDSKTGYLVDEGDVEGMAERMLRLARNPALAATLGRRAAEHVRRNFSMQQSIETLWQILQEASSRRTGQESRSRANVRPSSTASV